MIVVTTTVPWNRMAFELAVIGTLGAVQVRLVVQHQPGHTDQCTERCGSNGYGPQVFSWRPLLGRGLAYPSEPWTAPTNRSAFVSRSAAGLMMAAVEPNREHGAYAGPGVALK